MYIAPLTAGDSRSFTIPSYTDPQTGEVISPSNGWAVEFRISGNGNDLDISGDANWVVSLATTDTTGLTAGLSFYSIIATKDDRRLTIDKGRVEILDDPANMSSSTEVKSQTRRDLEAVQLAIRTIIAKGAVRDYQIAGRQLRNYELTELMTLETTLKVRVKREEQAQNIKDGRSTGRLSLVRFK